MFSACTALIDSSLLLFINDYGFNFVLLNESIYPRFKSGLYLRIELLKTVDAPSLAVFLALFIYL